MLTFDASLARRLERRAAPVSERLGLSIVVFSKGEDEGDVTDLTGRYHAFFDENRVAALVVRPDFYIHGAAADAAAAEALLDCSIPV